MTTQEAPCGNGQCLHAGPSALQSEHSYMASCYQPVSGRVGQTPYFISGHANGKPTPHKLEREREGCMCGRIVSSASTHFNTSVPLGSVLVP